MARFNSLKVCYALSLQFGKKQYLCNIVELINVNEAVTHICQLHGRSKMSCQTGQWLVALTLSGICGFGLWLCVAVDEVKITALSSLDHRPGYLL